MLEAIVKIFGDFDIAEQKQHAKLRRLAEQRTAHHILAEPDPGPFGPLCQRLPLFGDTAVPSLIETCGAVLLARLKSLHYTKQM